ncbi:hypothetical protein PV416_35735 [Streptomyces ipomoeae]|uniref:Uncharacterized protein n=1 Tax=Streptomyces ipomoeae 91-03 TaxID=698759 RepID=L1KWS2_9ACTN|nr:hypothetical protein [Streptomyces ipomoeae]EKX64925.1 hypothetical protein STRIP9103_09558 [Streptomyces ipomoeae 91-03]MDX2826280.1 hypothetical protein [Streptomyces ipomoeae]MDX2878983.1 hypothetical protein [Streptomyces ipomoeae]
MAPEQVLTDRRTAPSRGRPTAWAIGPGIWRIETGDARAGVTHYSMVTGGPVRTGGSAEAVRVGQRRLHHVAETPVADKVPTRTAPPRRSGTACIRSAICVFPAPG